MNWPLMILAALIVLGSLVMAADRFGPVETYTISVRDMPNVAAPLCGDTESVDLPRETVAS